MSDLTWANLRDSWAWHTGDGGPDYSQARADQANAWLADHDAAIRAEGIAIGYRDGMKDGAAQTRAEVAREIGNRLPQVLSDDAQDECGWLSDGQDAAIEIDGVWSVRFHGEGSIDLQHITEHAARIAEGKETNDVHD